MKSGWPETDSATVTKESNFTEFSPKVLRAIVKSNESVRGEVGSNMKT